MNAQQCIEKFHNYVSDELDSDFELQLVNDAKNAIESELQLEITKVLDSDNSVTAGNDYSSSYLLPEDFLSPLTIYVGTSPVFPVPFEQQQFYRNMNGFYWIDLSNNRYFLSGVQASDQPIYFYYQQATGEFALDDSPVWPSQFHSIIPLEMARIYWQIDQGEKNRAWTTEYQADYLRWKRLIQDWDARLKLNAIGFSATPNSDVMPSESRINL